MKAEFDIPPDADEVVFNFEEVLKKDMSAKRRTPTWSGQDVLAIGLNNELSSWIIDHINAVRVWPSGIIGWLKKIRVLLRMIVKHNLFGSAMTLAVLLNTMVMGMERYDMEETDIIWTEKASTVFTYLFIVEMSMKLIALGPKKYLADSWNWLDGSVVCLSLIEIITTVLGSSGGNLSAFSTIRVLRTFRILRVARLLRALKSMKVILAVILGSAQSFIMITLLMFVFVFIYTLLGM